MRDSCLYCVRKHLSQAWVLRGECAQGYPQHRTLVIGHLAEAADEAAQRFPKLAAAIRAERLAYEKNKNYCPNFKALVGELERLLNRQGIDGLGQGFVPAANLVMGLALGGLGLFALWGATRKNR